MADRRTDGEKPSQNRSGVREYLIRRLTEDRATRGLLITLVLALFIGLLCFWFYNTAHKFDGYSVVERVEKEDIDGTQYAMLNGYIIKYSPDGIFCVDEKNNVKWSTAFSMQTPISNVMGSSMILAEQHGKHVYILNKSGVKGSFETELPIQRAYVSSDGVAALILQDTDTARIALYTSEGTKIAEIKATLTETGYPLDIAITPDAKHLMVSYLGVKGGVLTGSIAFYDFSKSNSDGEPLTACVEYPRTVFPEVFYADRSTPVAIGDNGFIVYSGKGDGKERENTTFDREIVSVFHDDSNVGFVFHSDDTELRYEAVVYNYSGKRVMDTKFNAEYTGVRMENGEILFYDAESLTIYRTSGKQKLGVSYEKPVSFFTKIPGFRKYLVITDESMDQIQIR